MCSSPFQRASQEASRCNRCGFCQTACPVYQVTRKESSTARGHHYQVCSISEGRLPMSADLGRTLNECLLCRACVPQCAPRVQTDRVVAAARQALASRDHRARALTLLLRKIMLNPRKQARYARFAAAVWGLGLTRIAAMGGPGLSKGHHLLPDLPAQSLVERTRGMMLAPSPAKGRVAYFLGCGMNYLLPQAGEATIRMLVASGFAVTVTRNYCCGLPSYASGDIVTARRLAKGNLRLLNARGIETIVTDCASCSSFLKGYAGLLEDDPTFAPIAADFAGKVLDITELFARETPRSTGLDSSLTVTYHDPCHASRYQGIKEEPRRVLKSIPGLTLIEMEEADWCCGGAGAYSIAHPELSERILDRKIENAARTGADAIVTSCPACMLQLSYGVRKHGLAMRVLYLSQVLEMAIDRDRGGLSINCEGKTCRP